MSFIVTYTGRKFDFDSFGPQDICPTDISVALSRLCRFTGHSLRFYSVAEHTLHGLRLIPSGDTQLAREWLLHDAAEAYVGDISSPLKRSRAFVAVRLLEARVAEAVHERFGVNPQLSEDVKQIDLQMLATEKDQLLMNPHGEWHCLQNVKAAPIALSDIPSWKAAAMLESAFDDLFGPTRTVAGSQADVHSADAEPLPVG